MLTRVLGFSQDPFCCPFLLFFYQTQGKCPCIVETQDPVEFLRLFHVHVGDQVPVLVECRLDRCMPQLVLNVLYVLSLFDPECNVRVPQIVEPYFRTPALFNAGRKYLPNVLVGCAVWI